MKAERFYGDADGPDLVIGVADDGAALPECKGWTCGGCDALYADRPAAEACCTNRPRLRLYVAAS